MRVLIFLTFISISQLFAETSAAQTISLSIREMSVREVIREIEKQSKYSFLYNDNFTDLNKLVGEIEVHADIDTAISSVLENTNLTYKILDDNLIVIAPNQQQEITVTGTVSSVIDGMGIPGATVSIRGTQIGTITDIDGRYSIVVPSETVVLQFTYIGMKTEERIVGTQRTINVILDADVIGLDEIVVVGYGYQRKRDLSGSVTSIRSEDINNMAVSSIDRAMQGRAAGVEVTANSGVPGGAVSIIVRGAGSIWGDNQPLYIVDGVQVFSGDASRRLSESNALAGLNFDDIESIDILKDASAAAIYGAQGANGVVIITTKRGRVDPDAKTRFNFQLSRGYTQIIKKLDVMNGAQWAETYVESYRNRYGESHNSYLNQVAFAERSGWLRVMPDGSLDFSVAPGDDWMDAVFRTGNMVEARLSATGGTDRTRFFISGSYNNTEGHVIESTFNRGTFRLNLDHKVSNRLSFDNSTSISVFGQNTVPYGGTYSNPVRGAAMMVPVNPIKNPDGSYYGVPRNAYGNIYANFIHDAYIDYNKGITTKIVQNLALNYDITDKLRFRSAWGADVSDVTENEFRDPRSSAGSVDNGLVYNYHTRYFIWQSTNTLNYTTNFGEKHDFSSLAGFEYKQRIYESLSAVGAGLPGYMFDILSATAEPRTASADYSTYKNAGVFGRVNYTYDDKYLSTFTLRYDGSSRFGLENRWGLFPSGAFAWRISSEPFMQSFSNLDDMKIRVSYGTSGTMSGIGDFAGRGLFGGGSSYLNQPGIFPSSLPNVYLNWEKSATANAGISILAYRGRINLDVDVFRRISSDLLLSRPLPTSTGWSSITENVGKVKNDGIEFTIRTLNIRGSKFQWSTDFNISYGKNVILELLPGQDKLNRYTAVGRAVGEADRLKWAGVNPADGRPMWYDKDMNITYRPTAEDEWPVGPPRPTHFGGITNHFSYGNLSMSIFFQGAGGHTTYISDKSRLHRSNNTVDRNQYTYVYFDRWQTPGQITDVPRTVHANRYGSNVIANNSTSSLHYERADYIRLKDISISYRFPRQFVERYKLDNLEIYATGTNLLIWTDYRGGYDPELGDAYDQGTYPQGKVFNFGIRTNF